MRKVRVLAKVLFLVLGFFLVWFVVVRVTSGARALKVSGHGEFSGEWDGTMRIGCYNIAHGRGDEPGGSNWEGGSKEQRRERLAEIAGLIREMNLDVVILNEVDFDCTWSHGVNQAQVLAKECGFAFVAEQRNLDLGVPFFRVAIGNAVLSRFPIKGADRVEYPSVKWWEPIVAGKKDGAKVILELPNGAGIEVFGVHAETRDQDVRIGSVEALIEAAGERSVLTGDFNSVRAGDGSTAVDLVLGDGRWKESAAEGATFPTEDPTRRIDWIFVPQNWEELESEVIVSDLSDHAMVVGEWRVR